MRFEGMVELRGIEPHDDSRAMDAKSQHNLAKDKQKQTLVSSIKAGEKQKPHTSTQKEYRLLRQKRVPREYQFPPDLTEVVAAWDSLSQKEKEEILRIIKVHRKGK